MSAGRRILLLWLLTMVAGVLVVAQTRVAADVSFFLPVRPTSEQRLLVDQLREGAVSRLLMIGVSGGDAGGRAVLSRLLRARLAERPEFALVRNGDAAGLEADRDFLFRHRYLLSPTVSAERFSVDGLQKAIGESVDLLASPAGVLVKRLLPQDPTGELVGLLSGLDAGVQPNVLAGVWASRDGQRAVLLAQTTALGSDTDGQAAAIAAIDAAFAAARADSGIGDASLQIAGPGVFAVHAREQVKGEVTRLSTIGTLAIVTLLFVVYRSFRLLLLGLLPVASGALAGVVVVSLLFGSVFGVTIGFGSALIGEAIDYSIYYFVQSAGSDGVAWRARFWPTIRLGVLTSVCGFGVLLFSGFPGLIQLGLYSLAGLLTAAVVTRFVLPQLSTGAGMTRDLAPLGLFFARAIDWLARGRWLIVALAVLAAVWLAVRPQALWGGELAALGTLRGEDVANDSSLRADLATPDARLLVVVEAADREAVLRAAEETAHRLDRLVVAGVIGGYDTPTRFLPSTATQAARQASLPAAGDLRPRLGQALAGSPLAASKLEPFLRDIEAARTAPLIDEQTLRGSTLALAVDALLLARRGGGWSILLPLRQPGGAPEIDAAALRRGLDGSAALVVDLKTEFDGLYAQYFAEARFLAALAFLAIVCLLAVTLRSLGRVLRVVLPLLLAVLIVTAALGLRGVQLQLLHLIGLLLIVAIGSNYALFFDRLADGLASEAQTVASLLVACLTTAIGFGTLALAEHPVLRAIGITVGPGAILALVFSALFARAGRRAA